MLILLVGNFFFSKRWNLISFKIFDSIHTTQCDDICLVADIKTNKAIFITSTDSSEEKIKKWEEMLAVIEDQYTNWTSFDLIEKLGGLNNESKVNKALSENINLKNLWLKLSKLKETANCIIFSLILYWNEDAKKNYINLVENVFQGYIYLKVKR